MNLNNYTHIYLSSSIKSFFIIVIIIVDLLRLSLIISIDEFAIEKLNRHKYY